MVHAIVRADVPKGAIGRDYRTDCYIIVEATDTVHARRGVIDAAKQNHYLVCEFLYVSEYDGPIPPEGGRWRIIP